MSYRNLWVVTAALVLVAMGAEGCSAAPSATDVSTVAPTPEPVARAVGPTLTPDAAGASNAGLSPGPSPSPTTDARPSLGYPDSESHGTMTISFEVPARPSLTADLVCTWEAGPLVSGLSAQSGGGGSISEMLAGEEVFFNLDPLPRWEGDPLFVIYHSGAEYRPGPATGTEAVVKSATDWASGSIRFENLSPDPESADEGPLPSPLSDWIRPIGGDPAMASLTGTVSWSCDPAPTAVPAGSIVPPTPRPIPTASPTPSYPASPPFFDGVPPLALESGDQRQWGDTWCGYNGGDLCAPGENGALGVESIVMVPGGGSLTFELPPSCHFLNWSLAWVAQAEHERWRGEWPYPSAQYVASGGKTKGRILEHAAPPAGDWSVLLSFISTCNGPETGGIDDLFRVVVQG